MLQELRTQFNVIGALTVHNLQGQMKKYNHGYAWVILEPILFIAFIRLARQFFSPLAPPNNMPPLTFYTLGIIPLFLYMEVMKDVYSDAGSPSKLLQFPRVTPIDIAVASGLASFCVYFVLFWIFVLPLSIYEGAWPPKNPLGVIETLLALWVFSVALGLALSAPFRVFPPVNQFISFVNRGIRMIAGMFFVITMIPTNLWPYLTWDPLLHLNEFMRDSWFASYTSPVADAGFVAECTLGLLVLGLSLERFMRRVPYT
jgi:capsular polysaccharide transport system permease protein